MSLSVNNTGYSNSQAPSTARPSNATPSAAAPSTPTSTTTDSAKVFDPITGKTFILPIGVEISEEAIARMREEFADAPILSNQQEEKALEAMSAARARELERQKNAASLPPGYINVSADNIGTHEMTIGLWSNHLKEDSGISKEEFLGLVKTALSSPPEVSLWSYTTDSMEIAITASKLETLKNRYVDNDYQHQADRDIQGIIQFKSDALSNLEKNLLQDEYQRSVDAGDTDKANTTFLELQRNAEGTSATQLQRQQIFSLAASTDVSAWFGSFRDYIASSNFDRYTKSEYDSIVNAFYKHWITFQEALQ
ncbi:hypothetical protein ABRQ07_18200 [Pectobacterium polonicum]|uniref:IpaD/SipD/SspD family type III secretion system needle tip protein n=1 Tax=Pectobacterium polonicum TaxID=2485124 RepID=A0ABV1PEC2_9GAMM|nr:hypothetical protein [Pectobacterium polonicum]MDC9820786.1 hypothetical protein [Pectobacterium polonicum]